MKKLIIITSVNVLIAIAAILYVWMAIPKTAFVDLHQLFENFQGKKELSTQLSRMENQQKLILDSLVLDIRSLQSKAEEKNEKAVLTKLNNKKSIYQQLHHEFTNQYQQQDEKLSDQVWTQINQYVLEYGEKHGYDYIYGTSGNGSLMYGSNAKNITLEVVGYINEKYEGI